MGHGALYRNSMNPKDIAKLINEDVDINNGLIYEQAISGIGILKDWDKLKKRLDAAERRYKSKSGKTKILVINGSDRNEDTCPQEESKSSRLCRRIIDTVNNEGAEATFLDLSRMTAEKDLMVWPCKGCFSTSAALCHYGCTCYPNESLNQNPDWMHDEIYELLMESHAYFIVSPVYWYSMPSVLKLMVDRMVCLDGANPDPRTTLDEHGDSVKDVEKAKELERGTEEGGDTIWDYKSNKVLRGRYFTMFVHGDADGLDNVEHAISETFKWYGLNEIKNNNQYIGYYKPYADSHKELDKDKGIWEGVELQARELVEAVNAARKKGMPKPELPDNKYLK